MNKILRLQSHLHLKSYVSIEKNALVRSFINMSSHKRTNNDTTSRFASKVRCVRAASSSASEDLSKKLTMSAIEVMETPDKSENDKKSYRVIRLPNGLKALLISDPSIEASEGATDTDSEKPETSAAVSSKEDEEENESEESEEESDDENEHSNRTKLAACSLSVDVGSFSDPRDVQGLAHFLEHMIFMGSEKYPNENEFDQYMQKAGGFDNADTDFDETSFYFETREEYLEGALDRFSQFFKAPLMLKEAMTRERQAVESEFLSKKNAETNRRGQLLSLLGQTTHPSSIFAWGNLKTLKDDIEDEKLYQKVHAFRKRHYSAHRMYVCLQSRLPLDDLQDLVNKHFSNIPNNQLTGDDFTKFNHSNAFDPKFYENVYFVKPIGNITKIDITWCLESMIKNFKTKPDHYLSFILGHEGKGSLLSYLRKKLWAVDLAAGTDDSGMGSNSLFSLFSICIYLTDDGFDHLEDVLSATFSFIKFLKKAGPNEQLFREIQNIEANSFRFAHERDALDNVEDLVISLKQYPPKYVLTGDSLYFEYDPEAIQKVINEINLRRCNIMITAARCYDDNVTYESTEPWFGTQYTERRMPDKWIELWENAKPFEEFSLPEPNPFIADDFKLLYDKSSVVPKHPTKILDNDLCELWFKADDKFLLPTACYYFYFMTPQAITSIDNMILKTLLTILLKYQFVEKLYPATAAGLEYSCYPADMGLVLKVSGFNQKLHLIVEVFTKCLKALAEEATEKQFQVFVDQQFKTYENIFLKPKVLTKELRLTLVEAHHMPLYEKNQRLRSIGFDDFQKYCRNFCQQMRIKAIMQGNISETHAQAVMQNVLNDLNCGKIENLSQIDLRTTKIPTGSSYLRCSTFHPTDVNTAITNIYQIGPISFRTHILIDLLMLVAQEPLFDKLRNKEQLAYDVSCDLRDNYGILSYSISVNSQENKHSVEHVDERIENFREEMLSTIADISDDDFNAFKATLAKIKLQEDNKLSEEVTRHWSEITTDEYEFDRAHKEVECLATITKTELLEFYRTHYGDAERKLSVQVIGNSSGEDCENVNGGGDQNDTNRNEDRETRRKRFDSLGYVDFKKPTRGQLISNLMEFKKTLEIYPVTKTNRRYV